MTISHYLNVDELKVSWDDKIYKLIYKKCHMRSYYYDINYHTTLNTLFSIVFIENILYYQVKSFIFIFLPKNLFNLASKY
jgi:hypothetical protein